MEPKREHKLAPAHASTSFATASASMSLKGPSTQSGILRPSPAAAAHSAAYGSSDARSYVCVGGVQSAGFCRRAGTLAQRRAPATTIMHPCKPE